MQQHKILRQKMEISGCTEGTGKQMQSLLGTIHKRQLLPLIDKICSELSATETLHRVDRLVIELGEIPMKTFSSSMTSSFEEIFKEKLSVAINDAPKVDADLELFSFFIHYGSLPWWADKSKTDLLQKSLNTLIQREPQTVRQILQSISGNNRILQRIVRAYSDELLEELTDLLAAKAWTGTASAVPETGTTSATAWLALLQEVSAEWGQSKVATRHLFWEQALSAAVIREQISVSPVSDFYCAILTRVAQGQGRSYPDLITALQRILDTGIVPTNSWVRKVLTMLAQALSASLEDPSEKGFAVTEPSALGQGSETNIEEPTAARALGTESVVPDQSSEAKIDEQDVPVDLSFSEVDALYVGNAGLVILWPFLPQFFHRLDFVENLAEKDSTPDWQFTNEAARQRAVGLLQYLASADEAPQEVLLPLNKVLCGMAVEAVFDFGPEISIREKKECDHLLTAVIQRAPILRDMSHAGFRGSFLLRQGQLSACDDKWLLRVERETHDVVLDRFPWGFSIVNLPWMTAMMQVEW